MLAYNIFDDSMASIYSTGTHFPNIQVKVITDFIVYLNEAFKLWDQ